MLIPWTAKLKWRVVFLLTSCFFYSVGSYAHTVTDGSMGAIVSLQGHFKIPENLGERVGDNLFHSFTSFNVASNESATFTGDSSINNVIARVTGGAASHIDGVLRSQIGTADFYFINPSGVVFGKDAKIDVPASFYVSTADELRFKDGISFNATHLGKSTLSAEIPESYGFLSDRSNEIEFLGSGSIDQNNAWQGTQFHLNPGSTFDLVGGAIRITGSQITTEGGSLRLIAQRGLGDITLGYTPDKATGGIIDINKSWLEPSGNGAGLSVIRSGIINIVDSNWYTDNWGGIDADKNSGLDLHATDLTIDNSQISTDTGDNGHAGNLLLQADNRIQMLNGAGVHSTAWSGTGDAGLVSVKSGDLAINGNGTVLSSTVEENSTGNSGGVNIDITKSINVTNGGYINTSSSSSGLAGQITVRAKDIMLDGQESAGSLITGIVSTANSVGNAGKVDIAISGSLAINAGATVSTGTYGKGDAGIVNLKSKQLTINGGSLNNVATGILSSAYPGSSGNADQINISVESNLNLLNGGQIYTSTYGQGKAGVINIQTGNLIVDGQKSVGFTGITASALDRSSGLVGNIFIQADKGIHLSNRAGISLRNYAVVNHAELIQPDYTQLTVLSPLIVLDSQSQITCESFGNVAASDIEINANHWLDLNNALINTSVSGTNGNGGDISIKTQVLILETGFIQANTNGQGDKGGQVAIDTQALITSGNNLYRGGNTPLAFKSGGFGYNVIQAAAPKGLTGGVDISSPQLNLSGVLAHFEPIIFEHSQLSEDFCSVGNESSLTKLGQGGVLPKAGNVIGF